MGRSTLSASLKLLIVILSLILSQTIREGRRKLEPHFHLMASLWQHPESKYWVACFTDADGRQRKKSTKIEAKEKNRREAQRIADDLEAAHKKRMTADQIFKLYSETRREVAGESIPATTVREFFTSYLERRKGEVSKATIAAYKGASTKFLAWLGTEADEEIHRVSRQHIRSFRDHVAGELHATTANQNVRNLRVFFHAAKADGYVDSDPCDGLSSLRVPKERTRRGFTVEELRIVLREAEGTEWASMVKFGLYTGQRLGDLARLRWTQIDLEAKEVRFTTAKTGTVVIVPMCGPLEDHVLSLPAGDRPDSYVHPELGALAEFSNGGPHLSRQFGDLLARCGFRALNSNHAKIEGRTGKQRAVKALSFHSLRHSAVSMMKNAGIPAVVVQDIVGHASEAVSQVYTKIETETKRTALAKLPTI
jgi:integrase